MKYLALKSRFVAMNFLEFAVWGAYLTSMGNYLGVSRTRHADWMVLCHSGYRLHFHARTNGCGG